MNAPIKKTHSTVKANNFVKLGWTVIYAIKEHDDSEPYEYILRWDHTEQKPIEEPCIDVIVNKLGAKC